MRAQRWSSLRLPASLRLEGHHLVMATVCDIDGVVALYFLPFNNITPTLLRMIAFNYTNVGLLHNGAFSPVCWFTRTQPITSFFSSDLQMTTSTTFDHLCPPFVRRRPPLTTFDHL